MRLSGLRQLLLHRLDPVDARMIIRLATGLDDIHQITESGMELSKKEEEEAKATYTTQMPELPSVPNSLPQIQRAVKSETQPELE